MSQMGDYFNAKMQEHQAVLNAVSNTMVGLVQDIQFMFDYEFNQMIGEKQAHRLLIFMRGQEHMNEDQREKFMAFYRSIDQPMNQVEGNPVYVSVEVRRDVGNLSIEGWLYMTKAVHVHEDGSESSLVGTFFAIQPSVEFIENGFAFAFALDEVMAITPAVPVTYYQNKT